MARRKQTQQWTWMLVVGALIAVLVIWSLNRGGGDAPVEPVNGTGDPVAPHGPDGGNDTTEQNTTPPPIVEVPVGDATALLREGFALQEEGKPIEARTALSRAYFSEKLTPAQADQARAALEILAQETLLNGMNYPNDPYTMSYVIASGDTLEGRKGIERSNELHVPEGMLMRINGIADARRIRAGDGLTLLKGPFHAIVDKNDFTMDVYLEREGLPKVFIKRFKVGLGKQGSTPEGEWTVGDKTEKQYWYAPPSSGLNGAIPYGSPDYALGTKGLWIGLKGAEGATQNFRGLGIHSTNKPDSIGTMDSLGCIRLGDTDIDSIYKMLYPTWSTVTIQP
jgi:lipoprotein-anchoring transpeptidase ErfK/SrfK